MDRRNVAHVHVRDGHSHGVQGPTRQDPDGSTLHWFGSLRLHSRIVSIDDAILSEAWDEAQFSLASLRNPLTGGSLNPARTLGSAVVANEWQDNYIYWIGPLWGGALAGILYR